MGPYGDCKVGAREESSSNLLQGEAGSVEVHQRRFPGVTPTLLPFGAGRESRAAALSVKPKTSAERREGCGGRSAQPSLIAVRSFRDILIPASCDLVDSNTC